jgi:hypothetical protein
MLPCRIEHHPVGHGSYGRRNVILGGVVGLGVDAMSGAMNKYPDMVTVAMTPDPACRARESTTKRRI